MPNKQASNVPNNIPRNPTLCFCFILNCFTSTFYQLSIFFRRFNYFHDIFYFFVWNYQSYFSDTKIFFWAPASAGDAAAVDPSGIKTHLANGSSKFFITGMPVFTNGSRILPRNASGCFICSHWDFVNFILTDELLTKALQSFETFLSVSNNVCGKLLKLPIIFNDNFRVTSVAFFIAVFDLFSYEFHWHCCTE